MPTLEKNKAAIQNLIARANSATGKADTDLTSGVNSLIEGFGKEDVVIYEGEVYVDEGATNNFTDDYTEGKTDGIAEGIEQGKKSQYDEFWDDFQNYGQRDDYDSAFRGSGYVYIRPKHKIIPTIAGTANNTFIYASKLKKIEAEYFDFSQVPYGTWAGQGCNYTFCSCGELEEIEDIGLPPTWGYTYTFAYDYNLHTIAKITVDENTKFDNAFNNCSGLINLTMAGTIGQNGFNTQWSKMLSKASWVSIMTTASTTANITITGSLVSVNKAFETSPGANDSSTSPEWLALKAARPTVSVSLV